MLKARRRALAALLCAWTALGGAPARADPLPLKAGQPVPPGLVTPGDVPRAVRDGVCLTTEEAAILAGQGSGCQLEVERLRGELQKRDTPPASYLLVGGVSLVVGVVLGVLAARQVTGR